MVGHFPREKRRRYGVRGFVQGCRDVKPALPIKTYRAFPVLDGRTGQIPGISPAAMTGYLRRGYPVIGAGSLDILPTFFQRSRLLVPITPLPLPSVQRELLRVTRHRKPPANGSGIRGVARLVYLPVLQEGRAGDRYRPVHYFPKTPAEHPRGRGRYLHG